MKKYIRSGLLGLTVCLAISSCKKDFKNPNNVTVDEALSTPSGITNVAIGLQRSYSTTRVGSIYNIVCANGFSTFELLNRNPGNTDETGLSKGGSSVDGSNNVLGNLWATDLKIVFEATRTINAAEGLGDKTYASGVIGYATIFKVLAQGALAMYWEKVPDTAGVGLTVNFVDRKVGFQNAIGNIDKALALIAANPPGSFVINSLPQGINIKNSLLAIKARYSIFIGNNAEALAAASAVDLTSKSEMRFDALNKNPIFEICTSTNNVFQVLDSTFGLPVGVRPDFATDTRIPFYMVINTSALPRWRINGFGAAIATPWPVYLPGEMTLIKAEAYARQSNIASAIIELNKVLTKKPADDPFGVGASQPAYAGAPTQAAVLNEIYRQRAIELYMQGYRLEDIRRFGRGSTTAISAENNRYFYPYPFRERDSNPNTPADPAF